MRLEAEASVGDYKIKDKREKALPSTASAFSLLSLIVFDKVGKPTERNRPIRGQVEGQLTKPERYGIMGT